MAGTYLSSIFGSSPIKPLQQHMQRVVNCVEELIPFTEAVLNQDIENRDLHQQRIVDLEHEADALKKDLRLHLPNSLFMPVDRRDLLEVLTMQDMVAGAARDVAGLIRGRNITLPANISDQYSQLISRCIDACRQALKAINELDELIETGFGKKEIAVVSEALEELDSIEHDTDVIQINIRHTIFSELEADIHPVETMFLYRLVDKTGAIADCAEKVGSRLQLMLAR